MARLSVPRLLVKLRTKFATCESSALCGVVAADGVSLNGHEPFREAADRFAPQVRPVLPKLPRSVIQGVEGSQCRYWVRYGLLASESIGGTGWRDVPSGP